MIPNKQFLIQSTLFCLLGLTGCSMSQLNSFKPVPPAAKWQEPLPATQAHDGKLSDLKNWWEQFNDSTLITLIEAAQKVSPDIESAKARVIAAQSSTTIADAQLLPAITLDASASRGRSGQILPTANGITFPTSNTLGINTSASWELDVWGKNKAAQNEEMAKLAGTNALWHEARVIIAAQTANYYINYRLCENLSKIAEQAADSSTETARLSDLTAKAGFLATSTASQAMAQASEAKNQFEKQSLQCTLIIKNVVALTAIAEPELRELLAKNIGVMPMPIGIEVSEIPAKLLSQRPDVLNAERNVDAASFEIVNNEAQRYPRLSLAGNIGLAYDSASHKLMTNRRRSSLNGLTWSIGPVEVSLPIFDAGVRDANIRAAKAQYDATKSTYESVARNAVREVEDAMATLNSATARLEDVNKAVDGFSISLAATDSRYKASLANLFELEEARRASFQAQNNLYALKNEQALAWVSLYRAMGGGWTLAMNTPTLALDRELKIAEPSNSATIPAIPVIDSASIKEQANP
jgi:NodT family efflux transporter outer membrane factor (OMF) lipoprotein